MTTLRTVVFKDGDMWVAQCLEHDVCVQACDLTTLRSRMEVAMAVEILQAVPPAPGRFFDMWDKRSQFNHSKQSEGVELEMALCA